jgi:hypothetical protein
MAEYKGIKGFKVQTVSTDPAASAIATGTWASGGPLNTARGYTNVAGTGSNATAFGGITTVRVGNTESYNGTSWTEVNDLNTARNCAGFGEYNSAIAASGYGTDITTAVELWNGTSWTETTDVNAGRNACMGIGTTQTAGLCVGGIGVPGPIVTSTESWNGSSWTEVNDLNTANAEASSGGTQTSGIIVKQTNTEVWNGTSWTETTESNTSRSIQSSSPSGASNSDMLYVGGLIPPATVLANTEYWNGTSWTELNDLTTARYAVNTGATAGATAALAVGGYSPTTGATEEWTVAPPASFSNVNLGQVFYNSTSNAFKVTQQSVLQVLGQVVVL